MSTSDPVLMVQLFCKRIETGRGGFSPVPPATKAGPISDKKPLFDTIPFLKAPFVAPLGDLKRAH